MRSILLIFFLLFSSRLFAAKEIGIDQLEALDVNGTRQWILCRGKNIAKPVALFVHGGPASPLMLFSRAFDETFLKDFIIVHWDQRQSGKSFEPTKSTHSFSIEQVAKDGLAVVDHLKKKFGKSKILLIGHSWGSVVGAAMVKSRPIDFLAYISVGTVANMEKGDSLKYQFLKDKVKQNGSAVDKTDFEKLGPPPWKEFPQLVIQSRLMTKFKGSFFALNRDQINEAVGKNKEYSAAEVKNLDLSMDTVWKHIGPVLRRYKAAESIPELNVPVYFAQGKHDMATPITLAKEYFDKLIAEEGKYWIEFSNSAHFPMYEEPESFLSLMKQAVK